MNNKILGLLLIIIIVIGMMYYLISNKNAPASVPPPSVDNSGNGPQPTAVNVTKVTGNVVSISGENVVLAVNGQNQTVSLTGALSFLKVLSGSIDGGNAALAQGKLTDIQPGQRLTISFDEQTKKVRTIFIEEK